MGYKEYSYSILYDPKKHFLIEKDYIDKETGSYNENTQKILLNMLDTEIKDRIKDMKKAQD